MSVPALPSGVTVTYNQQFRRCGKPDCPTCRPGSPGHGPYWYAYWREDGRLRSRYLGRSSPAGIAETPPAAAGALPGPALRRLRVRTPGGFGAWQLPQTGGLAAALPADAARLLPVQAWRRKALALFKCLLSVPDQRAHRDQLLEWLGPATAPEALFQVLHPALPTVFPPLKATPANPTKLPAALTSFVGRRQEQDAVTRLVLGDAAPRPRLVTLSGAGGSGKTPGAPGGHRAAQRVVPRPVCGRHLAGRACGAAREGSGRAPSPPPSACAMSRVAPCSTPCATPCARRSCCWCSTTAST